MRDASIRTWAAAVAARDFRTSLRAWLGLDIRRDLEKLIEFCWHRSRDELLTPAAVRHMAIAPVGPVKGADDDSDDGWSQAFGYEMRWNIVTCFQHALAVLPRWSAAVSRQGYAIAAQGGQHALVLPEQLQFMHNQLRFVGRAMRVQLDAVPVDRVQPGVASAHCRRFGSSHMQTLWVATVVQGEAPIRRFLQGELDAAVAEGTRDRLLTLWHQAVEDHLNASVTDDAALVTAFESEDSSRPAVLAKDVDRLRSQLLGALQLSNPLEPYRAWQRQKLQGLLNQQWHRCAHEWSVARFGFKRMLEGGNATILAVHPVVGDMLAVTAWAVDPVPTDDAVLNASQAASESLALPADVVGATLRLPALRELLHESALVRSDAQSVQTGKARLKFFNHGRLMLPLSEDVQAWLHRWGRELSPKASLWLHAEPVAADQLPLPPMTIALDVLHGGAAVQRRGAERSPEPVEIIDFAHACLGPAGATLISSLDYWPANLALDFVVPTQLTVAELSPGAALRKGLGTWHREAFSPTGHALLSAVFAACDPAVFGDRREMAQHVLSLGPADALAVAQFTCSMQAASLSHEDFAWALSFVDGGAANALVDVRAALQERLLQTDIGDDVPAWTLRGPAPLTYIRFAAPIELGHMQFEEDSPLLDRTQNLCGAYVWTRETQQGLDICIGLNTTGHQVRNSVPFSKVIEVTVDPEERRSFRDIAARGTKPGLTLGILMEEMVQGLLANPKSLPKEQIEQRLRPYRTALRAVMLVLLYMGLRDARLEEEVKTYSPNIGRGVAMALPAQAKARKPDKAVAFRRIRVGPEDFDDVPVEADEGRADSEPKVAPHWRRGHFYMQAYGPGWRERRQVWRKPVLVAAARLTGPLPMRKYDVG